MTTPRVAIDGTVLWGRGRYSGVEKTTDRILYRLLKDPQGLSYQLFVPRDWPGFEEGELPGGSIVRLPFPGHRKLRRIVWQQLELPLLLARWRVDLFFGPAYVMPLFSPCPAVIFVHDLHGLHGDQTTPANFRHHQLILPPALRRAAVVATPTEIVRQDVLPWRSRGGPVVVAPLGVDPCFSPAGKPPGGRPARRFLLYVGNLEERKGLRLLLEAFSRVNAPGPELWLAGKDRGLRGTLEAQAARLGITSRVRFLGRVSEPALVELYQDASAVVHPALSEGFGIPPLEAMACGTPVIAVSSAAAKENLAGAAVLVEPEADALAGAIRALLAHPEESAKRIEAGLALARKFTWDQTVEVVRGTLRLALRSSGWKEDGSKPQ